MLGFGEGEVEKKRTWRNGRPFLVLMFFLYLGFYRVLGKVFLCLFIYFFSFTFFFNTVLTWKIVGVSKVSVLYIYIDD